MEVPPCVLSWKDFKEFYHPHAYIPYLAILALARYAQLGIQVADLKAANIGIEVSASGRLRNFISLDLGSFRHVGGARWHKSKSLASFNKWMSEEFPEAYADIHPFSDIQAIAEAAWDKLKKLGREAAADAGLAEQLPDGTYVLRTFELSEMPRLPALPTWLNVNPKP